MGGVSVSSGLVLGPRDDIDFPRRLRRSALVTARGHGMPTSDIADWLTARRKTGNFHVTRIPFAELDHWSFDCETGNLGHRSGRFFRVEGLDVRIGEGPILQWQQPIINQPEVGILGLLVKEFDGVLHFLMQAKMEPGNPNLLQLSPTVQATYSNYTRAHEGDSVRYLDHFTGGRPVETLVDVLQSEHGAWFYRKFNRNMIVETAEDVETHEDFCWLTLGQLGELLRMDNLVNMDSRTVLSCVPVPDDGAGALHTDRELLSWHAAERSRRLVRVQQMPLASVRGWSRSPSSIEHEDGLYFRVVAVRAQASSREVDAWTQPLFEPREQALCAFLSRRFGGVPHLLVQIRVEAGFLDAIELGPTIQFTPRRGSHPQSHGGPAFLDSVLRADPAQIRYEVVHAEEGGRFLNAQVRYLIVDAGSSVPDEPPPGFRWFTLGQLNTLLRHSRYVNVQARTLLSALTTRAVEL
ncbi:NDP-hexose 2,3-dehydratase family protein [Amycolatopsis sp. NPDC059090]|uniref:NDP-hexose 2,3-dehydratase family protein n=1 Tax=unclassified Amycolatopsis TaxID=2618356 RepID=UPI00366C769C